MKKLIVLALVVSFVLGIAGTALAFPVDISGDFRLQGRMLDDQIQDTGGNVGGKANFWKMRARVGFEGKVDDTTSFYARIGMRTNFGGDTNNGNQGTFDQFGVKIKADNWTFNIGRQAVNLGQGTVLSTGSDVGIDNKLDGLTASTKMGAFDVNFIGGKTTAYAGTGSLSTPANVATEWYGADFSTKIDSKLALGFVYAHNKQATAGVQGMNNWAINTTFNATENLAFNGEYAKSNRSNLNKAYFLSGTYSWDKDSFTAQYQKIEQNAVDQYNSGLGNMVYMFGAPNNTDNGNYYKGFTYVYSHTMSKATSFHLIYMDYQVDGQSAHNKDLATGVVWKF